MGAVGNYINSLKQFNRLFRVVIALEGLERGSYYGMMAMAYVHFTFNLQVRASFAGGLMSLLMFFLYFVPIISSAVAERVGYKKVLAFAFVLYLIGNLFLAMPNLLFTLSPVGNSWYLLLPIISIGIAGGSFKPMVSATIAHTTEKSQRNFAYSIYYWIINAGAFAFPLLIGLVFIRVSQIYIPVIFIFSAILLLINLLITLKFYYEPVPINKDKEIIPYLKDLVLHMVKDWRFTLLLFIYSGFWVLFGQNHSFLPLYMYNFAIMPEWFNAALLAAINPLIIITFGPILAKFVEKHDSLHMMILGFTIFIFGFCLVGLIPIGLTLIIGIIFFSIGEFMTHPNFIAYVSKIAPEDKVAIYMGMIFLPTGFGLVIGNFVGGILYENIAQASEVGMPGRPSLYWAINICVPLLSLIGLLLYNKYVAHGLGKYDDDDLKDIDKPVEVEEVKVPASKAFGDKIANSKITPIAFALCIPLILFLGFSAGTVEFARADFDGHGGSAHGTADFSLEDYIEVQGPSDTFGGDLNEGDLGEHIMTLSVPEGEYLSAIYVKLTWEDEEDQQVGLFRTYANQPDSFILEVTHTGGPDGEGYEFSESEGPTANQRNNPGIISIIHSFDHEGRDSQVGTGDYKFSVTMNSAGDYQGMVLGSEDDGNNYSLEVTTTVYQKAE